MTLKRILIPRYYRYRGISGTCTDSVYSRSSRYSDSCKRKARFSLILIFQVRACAVSFFAFLICKFSANRCNPDPVTPKPEVQAQAKNYPWSMLHVYVQHLPGQCYMCVQHLSGQCYMCMSTPPWSMLHVYPAPLWSMLHVHVHTSLVNVVTCACQAPP